MTTTKSRKTTNGGPGLARLHKNPKAKAIRKAVQADQSKALAKAADAKKTQATKTAVKGNGAARHYALTDIITVLVKENPKMEGSAARKRFALYKTGMTVESALAAGLWAADIRHDSRKEHIRLSKS
jgi:hypothetical protein